MDTLNLFYSLSMRFQVVVSCQRCLFADDILPIASFSIYAKHIVLKQRQLLKSKKQKVDIIFKFRAEYRSSDG
uniref:Uncharacterized protein n=1 Tax=Wuchereria bancrofti TaxID=6293 RepID=A0A1I8ETY4_WUCBA